MIHHSPHVVEDIYIHALGKIVYNFAHLTTTIGWLGDVFFIDFSKIIKYYTVEKIATNFKTLIDCVDDVNYDTARLQSLADSFILIVKDRNNILHGKPFLDTSGEWKLFYTKGNERCNWSTEDILVVACSLEKTAAEADNLLVSSRLTLYTKSSQKLIQTAR